jgi:N-acyl amino acid synthase of PEP-CTERM/exosortase system
LSLIERINLGYGFRKYFRIDAATNDSLRDAVYGVRHEVYCEELKFEPERPDRRETDNFDAHSLHCIMRGVEAPLEPVGCTRLVLARPDDLHAPLPFELSCAATLDRSIIDPAHLPRHRIAEVSRLAVRSRWRRRKGDQRNSPASVSEEDFGTKAQPRFPYIPVGLYMGAIALAVHHEIDTLFVLTEPRLASHFARLGVDIRQIGGPIEHRGTRVPSMMDVHSIVRNMRMIMRPLWRAVNEDVARSLGK